MHYCQHTTRPLKVHIALYITHLSQLNFFSRRNFDEKLRYEDKLGAELFQQKTEIADRDRQLSDAKATMDKYLRDYDALFARTQKVRTFFSLFCIINLSCEVLLCSYFKRLLIPYCILSLTYMDLVF